MSYNFLRLTTDPAHKPIYRDPKRNLDGTVKPLTRDQNRWTPGRYKRPVRELILTLLLDAQREMRRLGPDPEMTLINQDQVRAIRYMLWREDVLIALNAMIRRELKLEAMQPGPCGVPAFTVPFLVNSIDSGVPEITVPGASVRALAEALGTPLHATHRALRKRVQELAAIAVQAYYPDPIPSLYMARTGEALQCGAHPSEDVDVLYTIEPEEPSTVEQLLMDLSA